MGEPDNDGSVIRAAILSDVRLYREGLARIIGGHEHIRVVVTADVADESIIRLREVRTDIALVDATTPAVLGILRRLREELPSVRAIVLAVAAVERDILACAEAGIAGYLTRDGSSDELVATIGTVARGESSCSPRFAATLLARIATLASEREQSDGAELTSRETEIARLIAGGLSNKEIAQTLFISPSTVKSHVHNILEKQGVHRRREAVAKLHPSDLARL